MATYTFDVCPHCDHDVRGHWGFRPLNSNVITCSNCKRTVHLTRGAVQRSWQDTIYGVAIVLVWLGIMIYQLSITWEGGDPPLALKVPYVAVVGFFIAAVVALPSKILGWAIGSYVAGEVGL